MKKVGSKSNIHIQYLRDGIFEAEKLIGQYAEEIRRILDKKEEVERLSAKFSHSLAHNLGPAFYIGQKVVVVTEFAVIGPAIVRSHLLEEGSNLWVYEVFMQGRPPCTTYEHNLAPYHRDLKIGPNNK